LMSIRGDVSNLKPGMPLSHQSAAEAVLSHCWLRQQSTNPRAILLIHRRG
jgi:hypothetical protein